MSADRNILVLGASGLIGRFLTDDLRVRGFDVTGVARTLVASQRRGAGDLELPVMSMDAAALAGAQELPSSANAVARAHDTGQLNTIFTAIAADISVGSSRLVENSGN